MSVEGFIRYLVKHVACVKDLGIECDYAEVVVVYVDIFVLIYRKTSKNVESPLRYWFLVRPNVINW